MPPVSLLRELEPLTHGERMQRMVALGRESVADPSIRRTIRALERGDFFERYLALQSCQGSRDGEHVLRAVGEPSRTIRGLAIELVPSLCDDAQAQAALDRLRPESRRHLAMRLAEAGRSGVVDALAERLAAENDAQYPTILTFASAPEVARHLPRLVPRFGRADWRRLARRHPRPAAEALREIIKNTAAIDERLIESVNEALPFLAEQVPDAALDLVRLLAPRVSLSRLALRQLAWKRPVETVRLALDFDDLGGLDVISLAPRLEPDQIVALVQRGAIHQYNLAALVQGLAPSQVARLFAVVGDGLRDTNQNDLIPPELIARLPTRERIVEARRFLAFPVLQTRPGVRVAYAGYLPWPEAWAILDPVLGDPDVDLRTAALVALATAVRYAPEHLGTLLSVAKAHQNEPDPVRSEVLGALAKLPPGRWTMAHLDDLGQIIAATIEATDLSSQTGSAVVRLVARIARFHPDWSAQWLARILRRRAQWFDPTSRYRGEGTGPLESWFGEPTAARLSTALRPILVEWAADYEGIGSLLQLLRGFDHRLRAFDGLDDILRRALLGPSEPRSVDVLLGYLGRFRPESFVAFVPEALARDRSWITRPAVVDFLQRKRQDLLGPFLGAPHLRGRFEAGRSRFVLPIFGHFQRWTARQQRRFARTLAALAADPATDVKTTESLVGRYACLPAASIAPLIILSHDQRTATQEIATRALGRLDADQGVPELIDALGDERARFAIYALRSAILRLPPDQALALLRKAPLEQVSVAKEVVRLLGDVRATASFAEIRALARQPLHRDVRVALLRALWNFPEEDETWRLFAEAARSPDRYLATVVGRIPAEGLSGQAYRRLIGVLATLLRHPEPLVRQAALERCAERPIEDLEKAVLSAMLELVTSRLPDERTVAAAAIVMVYGRRDPALVGDAVRRFRADRRALQTLADGLHSVLWEEPVSSRRQRIPRRALRRLRALSSSNLFLLQMTGLVRSTRRALLVPVARAMIAALQDDPLTAGLRIGLATRVLPWPEVGDHLRELAASGDLFSDTLARAVDGFLWVSHRSDREGLRELEASLRASGDPRLRRLGLAALVASTLPPGSWTPEAIALLDLYRADPSPEVAAPAQFTFPPEDR